MRTCYAMRTMIDEISTVCEDALFETQDPDGYGVWRTLVLDTMTTRTLSPLLRIMHDVRIARWDYRFGTTGDEDGRIHITFVGDPRADNTEPFGLDAAYRIMADPKD